MDDGSGILQAGFSIDKASRGAFGKGVYFAERSTKADEYAGSNKVKRGLLEEEHFYMLLCRVTMGNVKRITKYDSYAQPPRARCQWYFGVL